jgi:hypothetical protein
MLIGLYSVAASAVETALTGRHRGLITPGYPQDFARKLQSVLNARLNVEFKLMEIAFNGRSVDSYAASQIAADMPTHELSSRATSKRSAAVARLLNS